MARWTGRCFGNKLCACRRRGVANKAYILRVYINRMEKVSVAGICPVDEETARR